MVSPFPLWVSQHMVSSLNTHISLYHAERIPRQTPVVIISNHRSFMDAPLLMVAFNRTIRFACHPYMAQVPVLKNVVEHMGGFALKSSDAKHIEQYRSLLNQASQFLLSGEAVGIFPEGAHPMVQHTHPDHLGEFHRGVAHLLLRSPLQQVTIVPVAIASRSESIHSAFPVRLLHWFDPAEPLFDQNGWHPVVIYHNVNILVGHPITVTAKEQDNYQGRQGRVLSRKLTQQCHDEVYDLLHEGLSL